jgi:hypothetical protein
MNGNLCKEKNIPGARKTVIRTLRIQYRWGRQEEQDKIFNEVR